jgi:hypothetical protein
MLERQPHNLLSGKPMVGKGAKPSGKVSPNREAALAVIPKNCTITLLADRGFEHGELIRWLQAHQWSWVIRAKSELKITLTICLPLDQKLIRAT